MILRCMTTCILAWFLATLPTGPAALAASASPPRQFALTILHVNDSHSYLDASGLKLSLGETKTYALAGGWARLKTAVDSVRAEGGHTLLLHAGDAVQGDLYFLRYGGRPEMLLLGRLGFDALVPGNHEFDRGPDFLADLLGNTSVPVLAANIDAEETSALASRLKPYAVVRRGARRIGIIGLANSETPRISSPGPKTSFADEAATARRIAAELESQGIDIIILLTHAGLERDLELAATVPGVDVVVGGHSHSLLGDAQALGRLGLGSSGPYPMAVRAQDGANVLVVSAWKWGRILGRLDVHFDESGRITSHGGSPMLLLADSFKRKDAQGEKTELRGAQRDRTLQDICANPAAAVVAPDKDTDAFLAPYRQGVRAMRQKVIATASRDLPHILVPGTKPSLPGGSLVAPLVCRSMLARLDATGMGADMALQNAGGVRHGLDKGPVTLGQANTMLPFRNTLVVLTLSGAQVKAALEHGVTRSGGAFPYVAGARFAADMGRPEGERVTRIEVRAPGDGWQPLEPARTYRLVTNAYLARGGDGYDVLKGVAHQLDTGFVDADAFTDFLKATGVLAPPDESAITYRPAP